MASVTITDVQGHKALICFSGVDSVALWRADARPIPVAGIEAAQAAYCRTIGYRRYSPAGFGRPQPVCAGWHRALGAGSRRTVAASVDEPEAEQALVGALADSGLAGRFVADPSTIDGVALVLQAPDVQAAQALAQVLGSTPAIQARSASLRSASRPERRRFDRLG